MKIFGSWRSVLAPSEPGPRKRGARWKESRRRALVVAVCGAVLAMMLIAGVLPAVANVTGLDGGSGCYGFGESWSNGSGAGISTNGCSGSSAFLSGVSPNEIEYGAWHSQGKLVFWFGEAWSYAGHDLCYTWCSGYVNTASYW